jgi:hypothetical protein
MSKNDNQFNSNRVDSNQNRNMFNGDRGRYATDHAYMNDMQPPHMDTYATNFPVYNNAPYGGTNGGFMMGAPTRGSRGQYPGTGRPLIQKGYRKGGEDARNNPAPMKPPNMPPPPKVVKKLIPDRKPHTPKAHAPHHHRDLIEDTVHNARGDRSDITSNNRSMDASKSFNQVAHKVVSLSHKPTLFSSMGDVVKDVMKAYMEQGVHKYQEGVYTPHYSQDGSKIPPIPVVIHASGHEGGTPPPMADVYAAVEKTIVDALMDANGMYMKKNDNDVAINQDENGNDTLAKHSPTMVLVEMPGHLFATTLNEKIGNGVIKKTLDRCRIAQPFGNIKLPIPVVLHDKLTNFSHEGGGDWHSGSAGIDATTKLWTYMLRVENDQALTEESSEKDTTGIKRVIIPTDIELAAEQVAYLAAKKAYDEAMNAKTDLDCAINQMGELKDDDARVQKAQTVMQNVAFKYREAMKAHDMLVNPGSDRPDGVFSEPRFTTLGHEELELYKAIRKDPHAPLTGEFHIRREFYRIVRTWHSARERPLRKSSIIMNIAELADTHDTSLSNWFHDILNAYVYMEECLYVAAMDPVMIDDASFVQLNVALSLCHKNWCMDVVNVFRPNSNPIFFQPAIFMAHLIKLKTTTSPFKQVAHFNELDNTSLLKKVNDNADADFKKCVDTSLMNTMLLLFAEAVLMFEYTLTSENGLETYVKALKYAEATVLLYNNHMHNYGTDNSDSDLMRKLDHLQLVRTTELSRDKMSSHAIPDFKRMQKLRATVGAFEMQFELHHLCGGLIPKPSGVGYAEKLGHLESLRKKVLAPIPHDRNHRTMTLDTIAPPKGVQGHKDKKVHKTAKPKREMRAALPRNAPPNSQWPQRGRTPSSFQSEMRPSSSDRGRSSGRGDGRVRSQSRGRDPSSARGDGRVRSQSRGRDPSSVRGDGRVRSQSSRPKEFRDYTKKTHTTPDMSKTAPVVAASAIPGAVTSGLTAEYNHLF